MNDWFAEELWLAIALEAKYQDFLAFFSGWTRHTPGEESYQYSEFRTREQWYRRSEVKKFMKRVRKIRKRRSDG